MTRLHRIGLILSLLLLSEPIAAASPAETAPAPKTHHRLIPESPLLPPSPITFIAQADNSEADRTFAEARQLYNQGTADSYQQAIRQFKQALELYRAQGNRLREAQVLGWIGFVYHALGELQTALDYFTRSLPLRRQVGDKTGQAATLNNIGGVYSALGDQQTALDYYTQSLPLSRQVGDKATEATTLNNIGFVYHALGELQTALDYYDRSLPLSRQVGDKAQEATTLYNLAFTKRTQGHLTKALTDIEAAIAIIEDLRTKIDSEQLRQSYFAQKQGAYEFYIDLLMQLHQQNPDKGYDKQALSASERARARTLLEILAEANADIRAGVKPELREQELNLQQRINATASRQIELRSGSHTEEQATAIEQELDTLLRELDAVKAEIRKTSPKYAALTQPQPLSAEQIQQQVLDEDTLLLQYSLGEERSYLWAVTKNSFTTYALPPRAEIETAVRKFRRTVLDADLSQDTERLDRDTIPLSQILLSPVAEILGEKRLLVVPDGVLQYVPFAALSLPDAQTYQPLLLRHEIVSLPSASAIAILREQVKDRAPAPKAMALFADPVFEVSDDRLSGISEQTVAEAQGDTRNSDLTRAVNDLGIRGSFKRLPFTRKEADAILALVPDPEEFKAFDFQANRETVTHPQLSQYRFVHFATHGFLNPVNPALSGLVLSLVDEAGNSVEGFLRLHDIFNLNLPAELVVLSACQTGLGELVKGEGLVGLTRGFMYAGAPRLVVSLWNVNDLGTSILMSKFYQKYLEEGLTPAAALRAAQLEMWHDNEKWFAPYFWAAFTFQGEWR